MNKNHKAEIYHEKKYLWSFCGMINCAHNLINKDVLSPVTIQAASSFSH